MKKIKFNLIFSCLFSLVFFIVGLSTIKDYGVSWDSAIHFRRGQAYLHYFVTGETNYKSVPDQDLQGTFDNPDLVESPRRSFYQNDFHDAEFFFDDAGHPPINGIFAAFTNYIFYQKLGILGDIFSHNIFIVAASSLLVFVVAYFILSNYGLFASLVSVLSLVTYPLFFAESHFNIKDPVLTAFFAASVLLFYEALKRKSTKLLTLFFVVVGIALGVKLNIIFLPFIIIPYLVAKYGKKVTACKKVFSGLPSRFKLLIFIGPLITLLVFTVPWPFLWRNFPQNFIRFLEFYKDVGTGTQYQPSVFYFFGFNLFPVVWILVTTPPLTLLLTALGLYSITKRKKQERSLLILWLAWLIVPILRISFPGASIYGGVRQIMEFLPALTLFSGLGAVYICKLFKSTSSVELIIVLGFLWPMFILIRMHPNENVYFNSFVGSLSGAKERNFPSWGNSYGNVYKQGIEWINENADQNSKVALIQGTPANAPITLFRKDINFSNSNFSGIERKGEYLMELAYNDTSKDFHYAWDYVDRFLNPVHEEVVDDVAILKIWKNDIDNTIKSMKFEEHILDVSVNINIDGNAVIVEMPEIVKLSRIKLDFEKKDNCYPITNSYVETSIGEVTWSRQGDIIPGRQMYRKQNIQDENIEYFFPGTDAKYVRFWFDNSNSCGLNDPLVQVTVLN